MLKPAASCILLFVPLALPAMADTYSGNISLGARTQSNAIYSSSSSITRLRGEDVLLEPSPNPDSDKNLALGGFLNYAKPMGSTSANSFTMVLSGTLQKYGRYGGLDYSSLYSQWGISLKKSADSYDSIEPNVVLSASSSGYGSHSLLYGLGMDFQKNVSRALSVFGGISLLSNTINNKIGHDLNINQVQLSGTALYIPGTDNVFSTGYFFNRSISKDSFSNYANHILSINYTRRYAGLFGNNRKWELGMRYQYQWSHYEKPLVFIDPGLLRRDTRQNLAVTNSIPLQGHWAFKQEVGLIKADSNLPNFVYDNLSVTFSLVRSFAGN